MFDISIIIPNWNGEKQLTKNLPLLARTLSPSLLKTEVIVVDDASTDRSWAVLTNLNKKKLFSNLLLLRNDENLGFAGNVNRGVNKARASIVFLLNTDVVLAKGCLEAVLADFEDDQVFAVGANADWHLGIVSFKDGFLDISSPQKISKKETKPQYSFWVSGGHSAFRKSLWQELGGIDNLFSPFYFEETDLCYRAWKRGYQVLWEPKAQVDHRHEESVIRQNFSSEYIDFIAQRNQLFFNWKNIHDPAMLKRHYFNLMKRTFGHPKYFKVFFAAAKKLPRVLAKRRIEKEKAVLSDQEVFEKINHNIENF